MRRFTATLTGFKSPRPVPVRDRERGLEIAAAVILALALATAGRASPPVELELVTDRGVQITALHEWLQLLTAIGIRDVRIRGKRSGDQLQAVNIGTSELPRYRVVGNLTSGDRLQLPGGTFTQQDRAELKDYF